ncbi:MAG: hypothetical protein JW757_10525 [Anaerolineales bacterium]|nr:hypothetical protein [Anaerolineales bacterium]
MKEIMESSPAGGEPGVAARDSGQPGGQPGLGAEISLSDASQQGGGMAEDLAALIEKEVNRRFQSVKDKRWAQLEKQYRELSTLRQDADALRAAVEAAEAAAGEEAKPAAIGPDALEEKILSLANLPGIRGSEDATALLLRHREVGDLAAYLDLVEGLLALTLGGGEESSHPLVTAASAVIPAGGQAVDDLAQEYRRRRVQIRPGDINALTALKREFRQKGLDIF